ncbi:MAG: hypothetical protein EAX95_09195 [Candidatus Thorarchaeota archaeon]|nr:hypothetical protein [Candidatus Thorarchaeota archaeon]
MHLFRTLNCCNMQYITKQFSQMSVGGKIVSIRYGNPLQSFLRLRLAKSLLGAIHAANHVFSSKYVQQCAIAITFEIT